MSSNTESKPKFKPVVEGANALSLGISIVVALLLGIGAGYGLVKLTGLAWLFWLGVIWGVGAAILNVYKAYKQTKKELDELANDPKYKLP
ncbi:AtpZ/AtpI family protein [Helicobacter heilmannii]|uniref:ATP synthase protein I-like membrane protein n=1 Tax=Helicobacter heilmannii TaxID=35817 RepID=A0A0K2Y6V6_HELHE|nr:AtpZ/AtpI family protein [Helicobacter heilmannii]CCM11081.1 hypothetical protein BN341_10590 [Helicobacter heilmannii ASB1.4]CRI34593.1 ATP synthase protein I-like membrane protein [Helicobacter heilmannii]